MRKSWTVVVAISIATTLARADLRADYYANAAGKVGNELKAALHGIIDGHKVLPYREIWKALLYTDSACPVGLPDCGRVRLLYLGHERSMAQKRGRGAARHDSWEREHVWPKSRGFKQESQNGYTDLHHLRPADSNINHKRSNYGYDMGGETVVDKTVGDRVVPTEAKYDEVDASFEPPNRAKGQVARMIFYMAVRYEEGDGAPPEKMPDLFLRDTNRRVSEAWIGDLCTLLAWNNRSPQPLLSVVAMTGSWRCRATATRLLIGRTGSI